MTRKSVGEREQPNYTEFLRSLELVWISLAESHFSGDREQYFEQKEHQLDVSWKSRATHVEEEMFEVRADIAVRLSAPKAKGSFFDLTTSYLLHIHSPSPINRAHVERFTDSDVRLIIWPYVREYVSSISGRMHVPPVVLPLAGTK